MAQRDYILRLIEQMGQMLIALRNRMLGRRATPEEVSSALDTVAGQTGIDLGLARSATPETLRLLIAPTGEVEPGRCWLVAEMLAIDGLQAEMEGRAEQAFRSYERAVSLFSLLQPGGAYLVGLPEASERIGEVRQRMDALERSGTERAGDAGDGASREASR